MSLLIFVHQSHLVVCDQYIEKQAKCVYCSGITLPWKSLPDSKNPHSRVLNADKHLGLTVVRGTFDGSLSEKEITAGIFLIPSRLQAIKSKVLLGGIETPFDTVVDHVDHVSSRIAYISEKVGKCSCNF